MSGQSGGSVLLVEDSHCDAAFAAHALAQVGLRGVVHRLADGAAALDALLGPGSESLRRGLRVVILDINLPKVSGMEVLRRLREDPRSRRIPVVMMTSSAEPSDVAACYDLGANGYVVKAIDYEGFSAAVVSVVRYWTEVNASISETGKVQRPEGP